MHSSVVPDTTAITNDHTERTKKIKKGSFTSDRDTLTFAAAVPVKNIDLGIYLLKNQLSLRSYTVLAWSWFVVFSSSLVCLQSFSGLPLG